MESRRTFRHLLTLAWVALCFLGCTPTPPDLVQITNAVKEPSGLVKSRTYENVYWTHEDKGKSNHLFAINDHGELIAEIPVVGAKNVDWEDITVDDQGYLYVADIGNNGNDRKDLLVYKISEPDPHIVGASATVAQRIRFYYPEQMAWPDPAQENFDAEALFWDAGTLYLLTKHRSDTQSVLYRFPNASSDDEVSLEKLGAFNVGYDPVHEGGKVTAAEVHSGGTQLAVLAYHMVFIFARPAGEENWLSQPTQSISLDSDQMKQCEAIAWDDETLVILNESGQMHRVELSQP